MAIKLCVTDCIADCVWLAVPERTELGEHRKLRCRGRRRGTHRRLPTPQPPGKTSSIGPVGDGAFSIVPSGLAAGLAGRFWTSSICRTDLKRKINKRSRPRSTSRILIDADSFFVKSSTKDKIKGRIDEGKGKVKEKTGEAAGDSDLRDRGTAEKAGGKIQRKIGDVKKVFEK
jgi:uncharacterized protein YjbJ (UPF0337 family)